MWSRRRSATTVLSVGLAVAVALCLIVIGGVVGRTPPAATPTAPPPSAVDLLDRGITTTQDRLRRVPGDWQAWAALAMQYLERARIGIDPTYYPKAETAVRQSLTVRPDDNAPALVAMGALANARHDFTAARDHALAAVAVNSYDSQAYAVLADAQTQLGRTVEATAALQRLLDLRPGLSAYARASYDLELRGLDAQAADLMRRALAVAVDRYDIAFCRNQLGDLALAAGDLDLASAEYTAGLAADPASITLHRGQARLHAMAGDLPDALDGYATLTRRAPTPGYLLEYADLLRAAGRDDEAQAQLRLAAAAHTLFLANGGIDGLTGASLAIAAGQPDAAVREARAEWDRRQFVEVADVLGWALHLAGRDGEAIEYARRAFDTGATSAGYAYHLAMIELSLGDRAAAREHLRRALAINPAFAPLDAPMARAALTILEP